MKVRSDIVRMYKEIHGWVGIIAGMALFVAFFAGSITMFQEPLQRWASPPTTLPAPVSLERTPELVAKVLAAHPEAAKQYDVHLNTGPDEPARVSWRPRSKKGSHGGERITYYAALAQDGSLVVQQNVPSPVGRFVNLLHRKVGVMIDGAASDWLMGGVALLYAIALVSGTIVLLPSLVKDIFAMRVGQNVKRMWMDLHNVLGFMSLPFHLVIALTAVVFAFNDQFYTFQEATYAPGRERSEAVAPPDPVSTPISPAAALSRVKAQLPGFEPAIFSYSAGRKGESLRVRGFDPRYGNRGAVYTYAMLDPYTGTVTNTDFVGGRQDGWGATVTAFFTLHFGSYGGMPIRWTYFLLGLSGAFLFYSGNLLWVESRRRRERRNSGPVEQTRATKVLAALTVGVPLGCMAGVAVTIAAAKPLGAAATPGLHSLIYHAVFLAFTGWALLRGGARASLELIPGAAVAMLTIPLATIAFAASHPSRVPLVDAIAVLGAIGLAMTWKPTQRRVRLGRSDSVWSAKADPARNEAAPEPAE